MSADALAMLERGNVAPTDRFERLLGRAPRALSEMPVERESFGTPARLMWLLPLLRVSIGRCRIRTAIVSAWLYPRASSSRTSARVGAPAALAPLLLYGAALLDLAFGVLSLVWPRRPGPRARLWTLQIVLIVLYTGADQLALARILAASVWAALEESPMIALLFC